MHPFTLCNVYGPLIQEIDSGFRDIVCNYTYCLPVNLGVVGHVFFLFMLSKSHVVGQIHVLPDFGIV